VTRRERASHSYPPDYVSAETLAYRLDLAPSLIEIYVREGVLPPPELLGSLKRWDFAEVRAYIKARNGAGEDIEINGRKRDVYLERLKRGTSA
jgi:hypothetical protein